MPFPRRLGSSLIQQTREEQARADARAVQAQQEALEEARQQMYVNPPTFLGTATPRALNPDDTIRPGSFWPVSRQPTLDSLMEVEIDYSPELDMKRFGLKFAELRYDVQVGEWSLPEDDPDRMMRYVARQMAEAMARELEQKVLVLLNEQINAQNQIRNNDGVAAISRHGIDQARALLGGKRMKPEEATGIMSLKGLKPKKGSYDVGQNSFDFKLLNTDMAVWQEAEDMSHCLWDSYYSRIDKGEYIAYHIDAEHSKHGFTVGFKKKKKKWKLDECKGYKNHTSKVNDEVNWVCRRLEKELNKGG